MERQDFEAFSACVRTRGRAGRHFHTCSHHTGACERVEPSPKLEMQPTWRCVKCEPAGHSREKNRAAFQPCLPGWEIVFSIPRPAYQARYIPEHTQMHTHMHTHTLTQSSGTGLVSTPKTDMCVPHMCLYRLCSIFHWSMFLIKPQLCKLISPHWHSALTHINPCYLPLTNTHTGINQDKLALSARCCCRWALHSFQRSSLPLLILVWFRHF